MSVAEVQPRIVVVGLGYVGLPLAVALADHFPTVGFDIDRDRVSELARGNDRTRRPGPGCHDGAPDRRPDGNRERP